MPTLREFAKFAQAEGAKGIRETAYPDISVKDSRVQDEINKNLSEGYAAHLSVASNQVVINFYFNNEGFIQSNSVNEHDIFWTSTLSVGQKSPGTIFDGSGGGLYESAWEGNLIAVRCFNP